MKISYFLSIMLHIILVLAFLFYPSKPARIINPDDIFMVKMIGRTELPGGGGGEKGSGKVTTSAPLKKPSPSADKKLSPPKKEEKVAVPTRKEKKSSPKKEKEEASEGEGFSFSLSTGSGGGGGGSATGSIILDAKDFEFYYYLAIIRDKIASNWIPPYASIPAGETKKCIIYFKILRNGLITDSFIEVSCGIEILDQASLRAVIASSPFPPLPQTFSGDSLGVHFGFEYSY